MKTKTDFKIQVNESGVARVFLANNLISATTMGVDGALHSIWTLNGKKNEWYTTNENLDVFVERWHK